jgi:geranylgeranyl reductase family protein
MDMISIIGAGPAGCYLAYLLAKKGQKVRIFEEHSEIGKPIQCTGIVTEDIDRLIRLDKSIISNTTAKANIHSKNSNAVINTKEIILFRDKFDSYLLKLAVSAGAELYKNHKYESFDGNVIRFSNGKTYDTDILVGADGPNSKVARTNDLWLKREFYIGVQARVKLKSNPDTYDVYLGSDFPKFFGWIVPENSKTARVGVAAAKNPGVMFESFIKKLNIPKKSIIEKQAGLIPVYNPKQKLQNKNVFLIGDAAGMVKATTGGGIIPSMEAAGILCDCIISKKDYAKEFKRKVGKSLLVHLKIRQMLDKFEDKDYDLLLEYIKNRKVSDILSQTTRESPLRLVLKLLVAEPRFLRFALKLWI